MSQQVAAPDAGQQASPPVGWTPPPREALDYPVFYDPAPAVARWRGLRWTVGSRLVGLVVSLGIWLLIWWFSRDSIDAVFWSIFGVSMGISLVLLARSIVQLASAKAAIKRLHEGLALGIGRGGVYLDGYLPWSEVDHLVAVPGGMRGSGRLVVVATNGAWREIPVDWLSHSPSAVDGAVRALSGNRFSIDLAPLDG